jgi:NADPH:quinone reductase-like Zn-dependent oxidoreductase
MKAFILDRYGSADRVRAGDVPDPELREDELLVQIHAAGVNLLDSKLSHQPARAYAAVSSQLRISSLAPSHKIHPVFSTTCSPG